MQLNPLPKLWAAFSCTVLKHDCPVYLQNSRFCISAGMIVTLVLVLALSERWRCQVEGTVLDHLYISEGVQTHE